MDGRECQLGMEIGAHRNLVDMWGPNEISRRRGPRMWSPEGLWGDGVTQGVVKYVVVPLALINFKLLVLVCTHMCSDTHNNLLPMGSPPPG